MSRFATREGTRSYTKRMGSAAPGHFRDCHDLSVSSIGLGTYLGAHDDAVDAAYEAAVVTALRGGINVIDTAINYRFQRSERAVGAALKQLFATNELKRDEVFVATKGGFLPFDASPPLDPVQWFVEEYVETGVVKPSEVAAGSHCMSPSYLDNQIERSLENLQLDGVDLYYLHNPETQLAEVERADFWKRMHAAFEVLENAVREQRIRWYGVATWSGFRQTQGAREYLSLQDVVAVARAVAGREHHLKLIQTPHNLAMRECGRTRNQRVDGKNRMSCFEAARHFGLAVMTSASLLQGQLIRHLPSELTRVIPGLRTNAQRALQYARSTPEVTTALVGAKTIEHLHENLEVVRVPPLEKSTFSRLESQQESAPGR